MIQGGGVNCNYGALDPDEPLKEVIYYGEKGVLMGNQLVPEANMDKFKDLPRRIPLSPGHHKEWVDACLGGPPAGSDFVNHGGLLTEVCLLGNIAVRCQGTKLLWDGGNQKVTNYAAANKHLRREYRAGWSL